ncbi:MAG: HAD hydrolase-like protein [Anaerolineae bacterium]|nr:HAD hydrolase-like protein [Anaerolineae bacterium]
MTLTLLLDLDDTLIDSNMDEFIPIYFHALEKAMGEYVSPEKMLKYLMLGTSKMIAHDSPDETLGQLFDRNFYHNLGVDRSILDPKIAHFYDEIFPTFKYLTKVRPEAVDLVEWVFAQGYRVAISTNPLFPQKAVYHRLCWAGLAPEKYPFEVISSFENFHFSKPNPAYLAEVLGQMGWPDGPVLLVGDDPERDIQAAHKMGLSSFWIADNDDSLPDGYEPVAGRGSIGDVRPWLESVDQNTLLPRYQTQSAIAATMKSIPAVLKEILSPLPKDEWSFSPSTEEWSVVEIVSHIRDIEREVNLPRIKAFLIDENPFIAAGDTDAWAVERGYAQQDGEAVLGDFLAARLETLDVVRALKEEDWLRSGRHAIFGPITLEEQLGFMAEHDRVHLRQIFEIIRKDEKIKSI